MHNEPAVDVEVLLTLPVDPSPRCLLQAVQCFSSFATVSVPLHFVKVNGMIVVVQMHPPPPNYPLISGL